MGLINPTYNNRVRFKLLNEDFGQVIAQEPIEWKSDDVEYARHERYKGMFVDMSGTLTFVDDTADWLRLIRQTFGIQSKVQLIKEERHPDTDHWISGDLLDLDMSTFEDVEGKFSLKILTSGLYELLKARDGDKLEPERQTTYEGREIAPLSTKEIPITPRNIFLLSKLENSAENSFLAQNPFYCPTHNVIINSDQERVFSTQPNPQIGDPESYFVPWNQSDFNECFPVDTQFFYYRNDRTKTIKITLDFKIQIAFANSGSSNQFVRLRLQKSLYDENSLATPIQMYDLAYLNGHGGGGMQTLEYSNDPNAFPITLEEGECLALVINIQTPVPSSGYNQLQIIKSDIKITEDSWFDPSNSKVILTHELGQRITEIITDQPDAFYSETLGRTDIGYNQDGVNTGALTAFAHGMWIRGFDKEPEDDEENRYKAFSTSFKDWFESQSMTWNLGLGIEKIGFKERIRIEETAYFFNKNITIKLPEPVTNVKRYYDLKGFFSSIEAGYSKGGEYEEAMGLDEYNAKSSFSTFITKSKVILNLLNPYRADKYGAEFARRKPKINHPNEDTKYDTDVFMFDLKRFYSSFKERVWQDDFEQEPTGVYSPETATNLRLSPVNTILRHGWVIAAGLLKYPTKYIRYKESTANSKLKTKMPGKPEYAENGTIKNSNLDKPRHQSEWVEFDHPVDFELMQEIKGSSTINGKKIQNVYGLVEFTYKGEKEYGFLFNLKPNDKGRFKLLIANL